MTAAFRAAYSARACRDALSQGGRNSALFDQYQYYPLGSPELPVPGASFMLEADRLIGGKAAYLEGHAAGYWPTKREALEAYKDSLRRQLDVLYYRALWDDAFTLTLQLQGQRPTVRFILGHPWGYEAAGPCRARVMVVGKNPGMEEGRHCRNYCGEFGRILERAAREANIHDWDKWYVTNVCRFSNPSRTGDTKVPAAWIKDCLPLLHQELRLVRPAYILCLGAEAIVTLLGPGHNVTNTSGRVMALRYAIHDQGEAEQYHQCHVVTAPIALKADRYDDLLKGVLKLGALIEAGPAGLTDPEKANEHLVISNRKHLAAFCKRMEEEQPKVLAIDGEWEGRYPTEPGSYLRTLQISWAPRKSACLVLHERGGKPRLVTSPALLPQLTKLLKGPDKRIVGHYLTADLPWLKHFGLGFLLEQYQAPEDDPDPDGETRLFGWQKTVNQGGFDTQLAAHAYNETSFFDLEMIGTRHTTAPRWSVELETWRKERCKELGIKEKELDGYGWAPDTVLLGTLLKETACGWLAERSYSNYDSDVTRRLFDVFNGRNADGLLDHDVYGQNCREHFWVKMRGLPAALQVYMTGLLVDKQRGEENLRTYLEAKVLLLEDLRQAAHWPGFNPNSKYHCRELFFGPQYTGKVDKQTGVPVRVRPPGATSLGLLPYKSTGKRSKLWVDIVQRGQEALFSPSVDKEVLEVLAAEVPLARQLRDLRTIEQVTKGLLRPPRRTEDGDEAELDEDGEAIYDAGILSYILSDGRVHTHVSQTKETSRWSTWGPPLQNVAKKMEEYYKRILGSNYKYTLRSMFVAPPGYALVEADITAAEVCAAAWKSQDPALMDHSRRAMLKKSDPEFYDIHSNNAVRAFALKCLPTAKALEDAGLIHLRTAAKNYFFGWFYDQSVLSSWRKMREDGIEVSIQHVEALARTLAETYPVAVRYFEAAAERAWEPGWIINCGGMRRRFPQTDNENERANMGRECRNFDIQSVIAWAVERWFDHLLQVQRRDPELFTLPLQIHDAGLFYVPNDRIEGFVRDGGVLDQCMQQVPVVPCDFDGNPLEAGPYFFGLDKSVYIRWGEKPSVADCQAHGIEARWAKDYVPPVAGVAPRRRARTAKAGV